MFALCDCNSFYCSCEAVFCPRLWGRPVVVLSNNDGSVIARSPEAKAAGIPMGAPAHLWRDQFKEHGIAVFSSNYALYGDMSRRVMQVLREHHPGFPKDVFAYNAHTNAWSHVSTLPISLLAGGGAVWNGHDRSAGR